MRSLPLDSGVYHYPDLKTSLGAHHQKKKTGSDSPGFHCVTPVAGLLAGLGPRPAPALVGSAVAVDEAGLAFANDFATTRAVVRVIVIDQPVTIVVDGIATDFGNRNAHSTIGGIEVRLDGVEIGGEGTVHSGVIRRVTDVTHVVSATA